MASAAVRKLQKRIARYAASVEPEIARRLLRAYEVIRTSLNEAEIVALLNSGASAERVALSLANSADLDSFLVSELGPTLDQSALGAGAQFSIDLPDPLSRNGVKNGVSLLNPRVIDGLASLQTRVFAKVSKGVGNTIKQVIQRGLEDGIGSKAIARGIRESLALAPNQELAVHNFEKLLRERKLSTIIGRKPRPTDIRVPGRALRDRRFDGTLRKAFAPGGKGLSEAQIEKMTGAYRRRMEAFNANTQARSAALDATRKGQRMSWDDAIGKGLVKKEESWKRRHAVGDRRTRPEHAAIDLEEQKIDDPYSNGEMISGDSSHNCRCADEYFRRDLATRARPSRPSPLAPTPRAVNSTTILQPPPIPATAAPPVVAPGSQAGTALGEADAIFAAEGFAVEESIALDLVIPRGQGIPFISDDVLAAMAKAKPEKIRVDKIVVGSDAQASVELGRTKSFIRRQVKFEAGVLDESGFLADAPALWAADDGTFIILEGHHRVVAEAIRRETFIQARVFRPPPPAPSVTKVDGLWKPSTRATNPAKLTREGLLAHIPDDEIRRVLAATFPEYNSVDIAVGVYRRELIKKGLLPPKGIKPPPGGLKKPPPAPKPKPAPSPAPAVSGAEIESLEAALAEAETQLDSLQKLLKSDLDGISENLKIQLQRFGSTDGALVPGEVAVEALIKSGHMTRVGIGGRVELTVKGRGLVADLGINDQRTLKALVTRRKKALAKAEKAATAEIDVVTGVDPLKNAQAKLTALEESQGASAGERGVFIDPGDIAAIETRIKKMDKKILEYEARAAAREPIGSPGTTRIGERFIRNDQDRYLNQLRDQRARLDAQRQSAVAISEEAAARQGISPLTLPEAQQGTFEFYKKTVKGAKRIKADAAREWVEASVHKRWVGNTRVTVRGSSSSSSYQNAESIHMTAHAKTPVYTHEMGHSLDHFNRELVEAAEEFFKARAKNSKVKNLGYARQGGRETSRPNDFFSPYVGKTYNRFFGGADPIAAAESGAVSEMAASEILSMGLEAMMENPVLFARQDFGHFMFILEIMEGRIPTIFYGAENLANPILRLRASPKIVTFP